MGTQRLTSLDAFRGYTVAAMIMVNFPGSEEHVYPTLGHTHWNGLDFTDQIAPWFLFIIGLSIHLAYRGKTAAERPALYKKIIFRALKIFAIGMFLNLMPDFDFANIRWTGTLHRIAVVFLVCGILELHSGWKAQLGLAIGLLLAYWIMMMGIPTPGEGKVMLEPGHNLAAWVDSKWLPGRMWQGTWDPEGILVLIPSIAGTIMGMLVGRLFATTLPLERKLLYLFSTGVGLAVLGYFLGLVFPVNENLWTSSFVLVTGGFACLVLGTFSFVFDVLGKTRFAKPGVVFGVNAITAYILGDVFSLVFYQWKPGGISLNERFVTSLSNAGLDPRMASWIYALIFVSIVFLPCLWLYRKKIFIKV